jgi:hypothetical protein
MKREPKAPKHEGGHCIVETPMAGDPNSRVNANSLKPALEDTGLLEDFDFDSPDRTDMQDPPAQCGNDALQDYQVQLMQLEQQNRMRLMMKRKGKIASLKVTTAHLRQAV